MSCTDVQLTSPVLICQTAYASCTSSPSIATRLPLFALAWSTHLLTGNSKFSLRRSIVNLCEFFGKSLGSTMHIVFELENPSSSDPTGVPLWRFRSRPFWPVSSSTRGNTGAPCEYYSSKRSTASISMLSASSYSRWASASTLPCSLGINFRELILKLLAKKVHLPLQKFN